MADKPFRVELLTNEARQSLRFDVAPMGYGQAIICVDVAPGSEAEELGVRPGLRLTAVSDPIRRNDVWQLQDRPSLKNVRELLRMRSADTITLEFAPWDGPVPGASDGSMPATGDSSSTPSAPGSVMASLDSMASSSSSESIGDRLQRQYAEAQSGGRTPTAVEQRIARRNARLELDNQRNDTPLVLGLFAAFALPPLVILLVAQSSGYLDALYTNTLAGMR